MKNIKFVFLLVFMMSLFGLASVSAATFDQDFSGDNTNPTQLGVFAIGTTTVSGSVVDATGSAPDVDVFSFNIAADTVLTGIDVTSFASTDDLGFVAIDEGIGFPFNAAELGGGPDTSLFLGGALFGAGTDLFAAFASGALAGTGFTAPLGAGDYTIYVQQLGGAVIDYTFSFEVAAVPLPAAVWLFAAGLMGLFGWSKKKNFVKE